MSNLFENDEVLASLQRAHGDNYGALLFQQWNAFTRNQALSASDALAEEMGLDGGEYVVDDRLNRCDFCMGRLPVATITRGEKVYCCALCDVSGESGACSPRLIVMDAIFHLAAHRTSYDSAAIDFLRDKFKEVAILLL